MIEQYGKRKEFVSHCKKVTGWLDIWHPVGIYLLYLLSFFYQKLATYEPYQETDNEVYMVK